MTALEANHLLNLRVSALLDRTTTFPSIGRVTRSVQWHPSLWDQLQRAVARGSTSDGGTASKGTHSPVATSVLSLIMEIEEQTTRDLGALIRTNNAELRWLGNAGPFEIGPGPSTPANLRRLCTRFGAWPDAQSAWVKLLDQWIARADAALGNTPPRLSRIRGLHCPGCQARTAGQLIDGEMSRVPAVQVIWDGDSVKTLLCSVCRLEWLPENWARLAAGVSLRAASATV